VRADKGRSVFLRSLREIRRGCVEVVLPDGTTETVGDRRNASLRATLRIHDDVVFARLVKAADLVRVPRTRTLQASTHPPN